MDLPSLNILLQTSFKSSNNHIMEMNIFPVYFSVVFPAYNIVHSMHSHVSTEYPDMARSTGYNVIPN